MHPIATTTPDISNQLPVQTLQIQVRAPAPGPNPGPTSEANPGLNPGPNTGPNPDATARQCGHRTQTFDRNACAHPRRLYH